MRLTITPIDQNEFDGLREEWNQLLSRSRCDNVFLRWEWMHTWWSVFKRNRKLFIWTARREGQLVGIAPFYIDRAGLFGPRFLRLCSEELSPDYLDIMAEAGQE